MCPAGSAAQLSTKEAAMFMTLLLAAILPTPSSACSSSPRPSVMAGRSPHPRPMPVRGSLDDPAPHLSRLLVAHRVRGDRPGSPPLPAPRRPGRSRPGRSARPRRGRGRGCPRSAPAPRRVDSARRRRWLRSGSAAAGSAAEPPQQQQDHEQDGVRDQRRDQPHAAADLTLDAVHARAVLEHPGLDDPGRDRLVVRRLSTRAVQIVWSGSISSGNRNPTQYWRSSSGRGSPGRR